MTRLRWQLQKFPAALLPNTDEAHALCVVAVAAAGAVVVALVLMRVGDWMAR